MEQSLVAGAVALGAVCAMAATLILFPLIDRYVRPRFELERGGAMIVLLSLSLIIGTVAGFAGYFWMRERQEEQREETPSIQVLIGPEAGDDISARGNP